MRKIIVGYTSKSKYTARDADNKPIQAFEFIFDDAVLTALEQIQSEDLAMYGVMGKAVSDTGMSLGDCKLLVSGDEKQVFYEGYQGHQQAFTVGKCNDGQFETVASEFQEKIELSK